MKRPKYKFKLTISTSIDIQNNKKLVNGSLTTDTDYFISDLIYKPNVLIDSTYKGSEVTIHKYTIVGTLPVYSSSTTYTVYDGRIITFTQGAECIRIQVKYPDTFGAQRYDEDNFIMYEYYTHPRFKSLTRETSRENNQMFFRDTISSKFIFDCGTFDKIASLNINNGIILTVLNYNYTTSLYDEYFYSARITKFDCDLDYVKRTATVKFTANDNYTKILAKYSDNYKLNELNYGVSKVTHDFAPLAQIYVENSDHITNVLVGGYYDTEVTLPDLQTGQTMEDMLGGYGFIKQGTCMEFSFTLSTTSGTTEKVTFTGTLRANPSGNYWYSHESVNSFYNSQFLFRSDHDSNYRIKYSGGINTPAKLYVTDYLGTTIYYESDNSYTLRQIFSNIFVTTIRFTGQGTYSGTIAYTRDAVQYAIYTRLLTYDYEYLEHPKFVTDNIYGPISSDDFAYTGGNYRYWVAANLPSVLITSDESTETYKVGHKSSGKFYTDIYLPLDTKRVKYIPVDQSNWGNASLWMPLEWITNPTSASYSETSRMSWYDFMQANLLTIDQYISTLGQLIKALLAKIDNSIMFNEQADYSKFFYGQDTFWPVFTHRTNIQAGHPTQLAQAGEISIKDLMEGLRDYFRVYWYIDTDSSGNKRFRLEHVDYFNKVLHHTVVPVSLVLADETDQFNKQKYDDMFTELSYDDSDVYRRLEFGYSDETTIGFSELDIDIYDRFLESADSKEVSLSIFNSDTDYMFAEGDNLSDDGFVLLMCTKQQDGSFKTNRDAVTVGYRHNYTAYPGNSDMASINLLKWYMYDFPGVNISNSLLNVIRQKLCMTQTIKIPLDNMFSPYSAIHTRFGLGIVTSMKLDADTSYNEIELAFRPNDIPYTYTESTDTDYVVNYRVENETVIFNETERSDLYSNGYFTLGTDNFLEVLKRDGTAADFLLLLDELGTVNISGAFTFTGASGISTGQNIFMTCDVRNLQSTKDMIGITSEGAWVQNLNYTLYCGLYGVMPPSYPRPSYTSVHTEITGRYSQLPLINFSIVATKVEGAIQLNIILADSVNNVIAQGTNVISASLVSTRVTSPQHIILGDALRPSPYLKFKCFTIRKMQ